MDFAGTPEQAALRDVLRGFLRQHATPERVRQVMAGAGHDAAAWARLTGELGLAGLAVPERYGGAGATLAEVAVAVAEIGRVLLPVPYLSSALAAAVLAEAAGAGAAGEATREFLPGLADGSLIGAFALTGDVRLDRGASARGGADAGGGGDAGGEAEAGGGTSPAGGQVSGAARHVHHGPQADVFLVRAGDVLVAVRAADAVVTAAPALDQTCSQATVGFHGAPALPVSADGDGGALARRAEDLMRVGLAVESAAAASQCLSMTVEYLKTRVQFGRPIGQFQALKHRCADLAVEVESARAVALAAVQAAVSDPDELAVMGPLAKRHCADAFFHVAAEMIQLHGGIGFTWEHEAHLYLKRAKSTQLLYGSPGELRTLVGQRAGVIG